MSRTRSLLIAATASLLFLAGTAGQAHADESTTSLNDIIRSLAPIEYLPQHSGKRRAIDLDIPFEINSNRLTPRAKRQLDIVAEALRRRELREQRFEVVGHTDASGSKSLNLSLSKRRAEAVLTYLPGHHRIAAHRLKSIGKGESEIKNVLSPESAENRRVEFVLIQRDNGTAKTKPKSGGQKVIKW